MSKAVRDLVEAGKIRFFESEYWPSNATILTSKPAPMGKATCDERHYLYGGAYAGANSLDHVREEVEGADFVLYIGALKSDFKCVLQVDPISADNSARALSPSTLTPRSVMR